MDNVRKTAFVLLTITLAATLLSGCGQNPETPVYDTVANKHGFPPEACRLIDQVEAGQLVTYDLISEAFTGLYLERGELLENDDWRKVIVALGTKFRFKADELERRGPEFYTQAAGLYALAAFADPSLEKTAEKALLFSSWQKLAADFSAAGQAPPTGPETDQRASLLRLFSSADSLSGAFADRYLRGLLPTRRLGVEVVDSLSPVNRAFLASIGLCDPPREPLAQFAEPRIDLLAWAITPQRLDRQRVELYFACRDSLSADYWIGLALDSAAVGETTLERPAESDYFGLAPRTPTSRWRPGSVEALTAVVSREGPVGAAALGLFRLDRGERQWAAPADSASVMVRIPLPDSL